MNLTDGVNKLMAKSIAKKIGEKPEDVMWFFELKLLIQASRKGKLDNLAKKRKPIGINKTSTQLLKEAKEDIKKYKRIEKKLKEAGLV